MTKIEFAALAAIGVLAGGSYSAMQFAMTHAYEHGPVTAHWVDETNPDQIAPELAADCDTDEACARTPACRRDPTCDGGPVDGPRRAMVLVGEGCGPQRVTMVAREEDQFGTTCERIDAHYLPPITGE